MCSRTLSACPVVHVRVCVFVYCMHVLFSPTQDHAALIIRDSERDTKAADAQLEERRRVNLRAVFTAAKEEEEGFAENENRGGHIQ